MEKLWTVYQVENQINSRLYVGVHKTVDPNDDYMGSGKLIKRAIQKHGVENFAKKILLVTEDKSEAFALEKQLVTLDRIEAGELYNLKEGGEGGWDFANSTVDRVKLAKLATSARKILFETDALWRADLGKKISAGILASPNRNIRYGFLAFLGKKHTNETKKKISSSVQGKQSAEKNSQFGSFWCTNGTKSMKLKFGLEIPEGYRLGRVQNSMPS
jgi:predicted GIY-YIG superfamily endonuclease